YAEHFVLPAITLGTLILMSALDRERLALVGLAGVLFGVGFVIKQSGGAFAGFGLAWIFYRRLGGAAALKDHRRAPLEGAPPCAVGVSRGSSRAGGAAPPP